MTKKSLLAFVLVIAFVLAFSSAALAADEEFVKGFNKNLELYPNWIGVDAQGLPTTMPIFTYSTTEAATTHINEIVFVEVPCDTDRDGKRDRISLWIRRPVTQPGFLCPVVMEFSPYHAGTVTYPRLSAQINNPDDHIRGMAQSFLYKPNNNVNLKVNPDTTHLTYDDIKYKGIEAWDYLWWNTPGAFTTGSWYTGTDNTGTQTFVDEYGTTRTRKLYTGSVPPATVPTAVGTAGGTAAGAWRNGTSTVSPASRWAQYFVRGYAMIYGQLLGNRDCEGITNSQFVEEWLSAAAACAWLNGEAKAFTTRDGTVEVIADWANGHVALDGTSYPGTTPTLAAMAGIKGIKAIMPEAHVASWYEYYRSGGALHGPEGYGGEDMNLHSSFNFSRFNGDSASGIPPADGARFPKDPAQLAYVETQFYMMEKQDRDTGDYNVEWDFRNLTRAYGQIADDVGILQTNGQQDWNVMPRQAYGALQAWRDKWAGSKEGTYGTHKIVSGLTTHTNQIGRVVRGKDGVSRGMSKWYLMFLDHYLLGLDNKVDELMYDVNIANQKTGVMESFDFDNDKEERGTILPNTHYQTVYLTPGPSAATAGRLSYLPPAKKVESFTDMNVSAQILYLPRHLNATTTVSATITQNSTQGNFTPTSAQYNYTDDRVVGLHRTTAATAAELLAAVDKPVEGRLMYLSEPLTQDVQLSGTVVVYLNAAPTKATGNLTVALLEIGRIARVAVRAGSATTAGSSISVFPAANGAPAVNASPYGTASGRCGTTTSNFKYVTWGHTDIQNPSTDGKAWFEVPEQNYTPNYYFQTTAIVPGQYYNYVVEMNPYNYQFEAGQRIGIMVYGTDGLASPNLDTASTGGLDVQLGDGSYARIPLRAVAAPSAPVTLEVSSAQITPGDTFDITYSIKDNTAGFASFDLDLPFTSSVYAPVTVTPSAFLSDGTFDYNISGGILNVTYNSFNTVGNGELFTVTYKAATGAIAHSFSGALGVKVNSFKFSPFVINNEQDVKLAVKPGALRTYDYTVYLKPNKTKLVVGDTLTVDLMLVGGKNYTQIATEITFDNNQFDYLGYSNLQGWAASVTKAAANKIAVRSIPGMNMVTGAPCAEDVKLVTFTFKATGKFDAESLDSAIDFASILVSPAGGVTGTLTAPGKAADITWLKIGDAAMQANLLKFPNLYNVATGRTNAIFSNANADVIVEEVWIEAPVDTDYDGKRDLMRAVIRRPIQSLPERGGLLCPAVINMTPYSTSDSGNLFTAVSTNPYAGFADQGPAPTKFTHAAFVPRDYALQGTGVLKNLDAKGKADHWTTISGPENDRSYTALRDVTLRRVGVGPEAIAATHNQLLEYDMLKRTAAGYTDWHKTNFAWLPPARTPVSKQLNGASTTGAASSAGAFSAATFLPRGYAFIEYRITGGDYAEGFLNYGHYHEALAAAAVIDWLNGRVRGYTGPDGRVEVEAYWASGTAAASGTSYNGTCPIMAAVTGVEGLRTIWPAAPPVNSYNYYRENGLGYYPGGWVGEDLPAITMYCAGRFHNTASPIYPGANSPLWDTYWDWLLYNRYIMDEKSGDYGPYYEERNSLAFAADIRKDTGIVMFHGTNDGNVKFRHTGLYNEALKYHGVEVVKGIFHQGQHTGGFTTAGTWVAVADNVHAWLDNYLYGVNNGIADRVPNYQVQTNSDAYGNGTVVSSDVWPKATGYQNFYPQSGRVGALATTPPATVSAVTYKDNYIPLNATFLAANYNTILTNITNSATRRQYVTNGVDLANGLWDNMMIHLGNGGALSANNLNGWRNRIVGGLNNSTTAWGGPSNRYRLAGTALANTFSKTNEVEDRIMYLMPITQNFTISGALSVTAQVAASKNVGVISAMLVEWGPQVKIVALGSVDVRNPNPDGTIAFDVPALTNTSKGGSWFPNYTFQTADITPGQFYSYTWELDITEYICRAGRDLGLIIYGSDPEFTFMTKDPTEFTVNLGPGTYLSLPVVGAPITAPALALASVVVEEDLVEEVVLEDEDPVIEEEEVIEVVVDEDDVIK